MEPTIDLALHPAPPAGQTLIVVNRLLSSTAEQLNTFATTCENKLLMMHHKMLRLETGVKLLEAKLGSIPGSAHEPPPANLAAAATPSTAAAVQQPNAVAATAEMAETPPPEPVAAVPQTPEPELPQKKIKEDSRFAKYFKMVMVGVPKQVVAMKFAQETGFDGALLDDPDAPAPPGGDEPESDEE